MKHPFENLNNDQIDGFLKELSDIRENSRTQCCKCGYFKRQKSLVILTDEETGISRFSCTDCESGFQPVPKKGTNK